MLFATEKDVALENGHRDVEQLGVGLDLLAVDLVVAGVHDQKHQLKGHVAVRCSSCISLAISMESFAAGNAHGNAVTGLHQLVALDRHDEGGVHSSLRYFFDDAAFDQLIGFQSLFMGYLVLRLGQSAVA